MKFIIMGKNIEVTAGLRSAVEEKIGKLDKYFNDEVTANVTLSVEKERQKIIRAEEVSNDMYVSIDLVEEIIERQMRRYKTRLVNAKQAAAEFSKTYIEDDYEDEPDVKIVRTKKFGVKPMNPEEACVQMELLQHNFYVFLNSETDEVNVVYKRKNNTYGLIEPELD